MNQNGMQGAAGVPQQMGQQQLQQQPQMPGQDQPDNPQIMNFLNEANENNWKEESYRNRVRLQIDEQLRNVGQMENGQKSAEWEAQVFNRSRTREEYVKLVATLIWKLRDYNKKQARPGQGPVMNNPNQPQNPNQNPMAQQPMNNQMNPGQQRMPYPQQNFQNPPGMGQNRMPMNQQPNVMPGQNPIQGQNGMPQNMVNQMGIRPNPMVQQAQQQQPGGQPQGGPNPMNQPQNRPPMNPNFAPNNNMGGMPNNRFPQNNQSMNYFPKQGPPSQPSPVTPNGGFGTPSPMNTGVPSPMPNPGSQQSQPGMVQPGMGQNGPAGSYNNQNSLPSPNNNDEYHEKLKQLRKYIEPMSRIIAKREQEANRNPNSQNTQEMTRFKQEITKMKSLRDIILGNHQVTLQILYKCEKVLQQIAPVESGTGPKTTEEERNKDQHMCQALLDVVSAHIRKPNINHTLNRTFGPVLEKLRPEYIVTPRRSCQFEELKPKPTTAKIPSVLQGEVASLNKKFKARLDKSHSNSSGDVHIIVNINDASLPPVKELKITIPDGYPSIPPIIQNESDRGCITENKSDGMEMAEYDEDEDFLKVQEQYFDERLDSLGPDLVTLTQILSAWELSIRQALAKMNINYAKQRQMMLLAPTAL